MSINKALAKERGISQEDQDKIEELHKLLDKLINSAVEEGYPNKEEISELIHRTENMLQTLWSLPVDRSFHKLSRRYGFKSLWAGKVFICNDTGETVTIPNSVDECDYFVVGNGDWT